jgi:hypothetical protein
MIATTIGARCRGYAAQSSPRASSRPISWARSRHLSVASDGTTWFSYFDIVFDDFHFE